MVVSVLSNRLNLSGLSLPPKEERLYCGERLKIEVVVDYSKYPAIV
jgi:hypothetical protein